MAKSLAKALSKGVSAGAKSVAKSHASSAGRSVGGYVGQSASGSSVGKAAAPKLKKAKKDNKPARKIGKAQSKSFESHQKEQDKGLKFALASFNPDSNRAEAISRFKAIRKTANSLEGIPYVWGGGHGGFTDPRNGLDCSGAVSAVLHKAGVLDTPLTSGDMGQVVKPGPGPVSVYYNSDHTFMKIGNRYWGTSVGDSGSGGLGPHPAPSKAYLSEFSVGHVAGLKKGIKPTDGGEPAYEGKYSAVPADWRKAATKAAKTGNLEKVARKEGFPNAKDMLLRIGQRESNFGTAPTAGINTTGMETGKTQGVYGSQPPYQGVKVGPKPKNALKATALILSKSKRDKKYANSGQPSKIPLSSYGPDADYPARLKESDLGKGPAPTLRSGPSGVPQSQGGSYGLSLASYTGKKAKAKKSDKKAKGKAQKTKAPKTGKQTASDPTTDRAAIIKDFILSGRDDADAYVALGAELRGLAAPVVPTPTPTKKNKKAVNFASQRGAKRAVARTGGRHGHAKASAA